MKLQFQKILLHQEALPSPHNALTSNLNCPIYFNDLENVEIIVLLRIIVAKANFI